MLRQRDRIQRILTETIITLCNNGLDFSFELCVEGLLGITLDHHDILLVNIKEVVTIKHQSVNDANTSTETPGVTTPDVELTSATNVTEGRTNEEPKGKNTDFIFNETIMDVEAMPSGFPSTLPPVSISAIPSTPAATIPVFLPPLLSSAIPSCSSSAMSSGFAAIMSPCPATLMSSGSVSGSTGSDSDNVTQHTVEAPHSKVPRFDKTIMTQQMECLTDLARSISEIPSSTRRVAPAPVPEPAMVKDEPLAGCISPQATQPQLPATTGTSGIAHTTGLTFTDSNRLLPHDRHTTEPTQQTSDSPSKQSHKATSIAPVSQPPPPGMNQAAAMFYECDPATQLQHAPIMSRLLMGARGAGLEPMPQSHVTAGAMTTSTDIFDYMTTGLTLHSDTLPSVSSYNATREVKLFSCPQCSFTSKRKFNVERHVLRLHYFRCEKCHQFFRTEIDLKTYHLPHCHHDGDHSASTAAMLADMSSLTDAHQSGGMEHPGKHRLPEHAGISFPMVTAGLVQLLHPEPKMTIHHGIEPSGKCPEHVGKSKAHQGEHANALNPSENTGVVHKESGSSPLAEHGLSHMADHGTLHMTDHGSSHTTDRGSSHMTDHGSSHMTDHGSSHMTDHGSSHMTDHGPSHMTDHGSSHMTDHGSSHMAKHSTSHMGEHTSHHLAIDHGPLVSDHTKLHSLRHAEELAGMALSAAERHLLNVHVSHQGSDSEMTPSLPAASESMLSMHMPHQTPEHLDMDHSGLFYHLTEHASTSHT